MTGVTSLRHASVDASPVDLQSASGAGWLQKYTRLLVLVDVAALALAALVALFVRFGVSPGDLRGISYYAVAGSILLLWLAALGLSRCYEARFVGSGPEEFKRVGNASVRLIAVVALFGYSTRVELARGFVALFLPVGLLLLLVGRYVARVCLHRMRRQGRCGHRVLVVGTGPQLCELAEQLRREPLAGLNVVGACSDWPGDERALAELDVPVVGGLDGVVEALTLLRADTVAVAAGRGVNGPALRALAYELEGTGVDLLVAPALTNAAGSRISIRPVAGLPLLHLDEPELGGARKIAKGAFDKVLASVGLVVLAPLLVTIAIAVRVTSPGPALFRQRRVGRGGKEFPVWKYRSMTLGAEALRSSLDEINEHDGVLFKVREDPRVTPVGRVLRRFSLDEMPQLVNVLLGQMSLVGPRPPLRSEVDRYEGHAHRRLLVKPGMTGLWQISGRSDLSWDETVRLDLQYVENWSLGLDLVILAKTAVAVAKSRGAY